MDSRQKREVLIDGKIYTLSGSEANGYLQRLAAYINEIVLTLKKQEGFKKQSTEYQNVMVELNIADDYFRVREQNQKLERQKSEMEKEVYSIKHELVATQMKLEQVRRELAEKKKPRTPLKKNPTEEER